MQTRTVTLTVSLPLNLLQAIDAAAKTNAIPRSHWLRDAALARLSADAAFAADASLATRDSALDRAAPQLDQRGHSGIGNLGSAARDPRRPIPPPPPSASPRPPVSDADLDAFLLEITGDTDAER